MLNTENLTCDIEKSLKNMPHYVVSYEGNAIKPPETITNQNVYKLSIDKPHKICGLIAEGN